MMSLQTHKNYMVHFNNGQSFTGKLLMTDQAGLAMESITGEKWVWIPFTAVRQVVRIDD